MFSRNNPDKRHKLYFKWKNNSCNVQYTLNKSTPPGSPVSPVSVTDASERSLSGLEVWGFTATTKENFNIESFQSIFRVYMAMFKSIF